MHKDPIKQLNDKREKQNENPSRMVLCLLAVYSNPNNQQQRPKTGRAQRSHEFREIINSPHINVFGLDISFTVSLMSKILSINN